MSSPERQRRIGKYSKTIRELQDGIAALEDQCSKEIDRLSDALKPCANVLNAVRIMMKNQDRRENEESIYVAVQIAHEKALDALRETAPVDCLGK